jgi:hypothetical protein
MKAILFSLVFASAVSAQDASPYHRRIDDCYANQLLCVAHVIVDAIFATKRDPDQGSPLYSVEFFEGYDGRDCSSYSIVKTNLQHNRQSDNLRVCENLNYQYGNSRKTSCVKVDGESQSIRLTTVGPACNALAYQ